MKKKIYLSVCSIVVLFLISLTYILISKQSNINKVTDIVFEDTSHENSYVKVIYPQFSSRKYEDINLIIEKFAENLSIYHYDDDYINLELFLTYEITCHNDKWLSVIFDGYGHVKTAAHGNHLFFALTIDLENRKIVGFPDLYETTDEVYDILQTNFKAQFASRLLDKLMYTEDDPEYEEVKEEFSQLPFGVSEKEVLDKTKFYLCEDGVWISVILPYAISGHIEFEIPYEELEPYLK